MPPQLMQASTNAPATPANVTHDLDRPIVPFAFPFPRAFTIELRNAAGDSKGLNFVWVRSAARPGGP